MGMNEGEREDSSSADIIKEGVAGTEANKKINK